MRKAIVGTAALVVLSALLPVLPVAAQPAGERARPCVIAADGRCPNADLDEKVIGANDLSGINLTGASLNKAKLKDTDLSDANLRNADLMKAKLSGVDFTDADLRGTDFRRANLANVDFTGADLRGADLRGAVLTGAHFDPPTTKGSGSAACDVAFSCNGANLVGAKLSQASIVGGAFVDVNMRYADFSGATLTGTIIEDSSVSFANFSGATFNGVNVENSDLQYTIFAPHVKNTRIIGSTFSGVNFTKADFSKGTGADSALDVMITKTWFDASNFLGATTVKPLGGAGNTIMGTNFAADGTSTVTAIATGDSLTQGFGSARLIPDPIWAGRLGPWAPQTSICTKRYCEFLVANGEKYTYAYGASSSRYVLTLPEGGTVSECPSKQAPELKLTGKCTVTFTRDTTLTAAVKVPVTINNDAAHNMSQPGTFVNAERIDIGNGVTAWTTCRGAHTCSASLAYGLAATITVTNGYDEPLQLTCNGTLVEDDWNSQPGKVVSTYRIESVNRAITCTYIAS